MAAERELQGFITEGVKFFGGIYDAVMEGGEVQAAIRQGFRELGNAFGQMWPEQIAVVEPGAVFNPLYSDIAAENAPHAGLEAEATPSPAGITGQRETPAMRNGEDRDSGKLPSPSDIVNDPTSQPARQDRGQVRQPGREM